MLLLCLVSGCQERRLREAEARLESLRQKRAELETREVKPLQDELIDLRERLSQLEARETLWKKVMVLKAQETLARSWEGEEARMEALAAEAKLPPELLPTLARAQEAVEEKLPEQDAGVSTPTTPRAPAETRAMRFSRALGEGRMDEVAASLFKWEEWAEVTRQEAPEEESEQEPEEKQEDVKCERKSKGTAKCEAFPVGEGGQSPILLCDAREADQWWVVPFSEEGPLVARLPPAEYGSYRVVRALTPKLLLLEGRSPKPVQGMSAHGARVTSSRWLEVHELTRPGETTLRYTLAMEGLPGAKEATLLYADLLRNGGEDALWVAGDEVRAILQAPGSAVDTVWLRPQREVCGWLARRQDEALQPAKRACEAWAKRIEAPDAGSPAR
jgi:hypothetical protein